MLETLLGTITPYFPKRNETCLKNGLILCLCILDLETVCLNRFKKHVGKLTGKSDVSAHSHYKRLIRIFDNYAFSSFWLELLKYASHLCRLKSDYLLLDGTGWKHGQRWYHYLTWCVVCRGAAIPIYWIDLAKHGTSNFKERRALLKKAMKPFNLKDKPLLADYEYIGTEWVKFLTDHEIDFVIRLRHKTYKALIDQAEGKVTKRSRARCPEANSLIRRLANTLRSGELSSFSSWQKAPAQTPKSH